jgi:hypothetical protein
MNKIDPFGTRAAGIGLGDVSLGGNPHGSSSGQRRALGAGRTVISAIQVPAFSLPPVAAEGPPQGPYGHDFRAHGIPCEELP